MKKSLLSGVVKLMGKSGKSIGTKIANLAIVIGGGCLLLGALAYIGIPLISTIIQKTSPWAEQREAISNKNNIRDAYSAIIGSNVGVIPNNDFKKWFSSVEAKEIDISIPKIINYSPLFNDDSKTELLKKGFIDSINTDIIEQSVDSVKIIYDGSTIGEWKKGSLIKDYTEANDIDSKRIDQEITKVLKIEKNIKFKKWKKTNSQDEVTYTYNDEKTTVKIKGNIETDGVLFFTTDYKIAMELKLTDNGWELVQGTLEVKKI